MSTPIAIAQVDFKSLASKLLSLNSKVAEIKGKVCMKVGPNRCSPLNVVVCIFRCSISLPEIVSACPTANLKKVLCTWPTWERCLQTWNFNNSYCLGKHLTEQLVASYHGVRFPVAIVRPSLVLAVAGKPYPGYVGNLAGGRSGVALRMAALM